MKPFALTRGFGVVATAAVFAICFAAGGCALTDAYLDIGHAASAPKCSGASRVLVLGPITEKRPERVIVGVKKNGYGWDMAEVFLRKQQEPSIWVRKALAAKLTASGFKLADEGADAPPDAIRMHGVLQQFFVEPKVGFWSGEVHGIVVFELTVEMPDRRAFARRFVARYWTNEMVWLDSDLERALGNAANDSIDATSRALCELLLREEPT